MAYAWRKRPGISNGWIAHELALTVNTVRTWRSQFAADGPEACVTHPATRLQAREAREVPMRLPYWFAVGEPGQIGNLHA